MKSLSEKLMDVILDNIRMIHLNNKMLSHFKQAKSSFSETTEITESLAM